MKKELNISEILKDKPQGTRLYSPIFGECTFCYVCEDTDDICINRCNGEKAYFNPEGLYNTLGEVMLFPSKSMRDWSKFAWKEGDILVNKDGEVHIIFEGFDDDTYETFNGDNYLWKKDGSTMCFSEYEDDLQTSEFNKANKEDAQEYIRKIEKRLGGKLNRETLEIEKTQPKFKDGDIVSSEIRFIDSEDVIVETYIVHNDYLHGEKLNYYVGYSSKVSMIDYNSVINPENTSVKNTFLCYATEEEKKQLFDALAKEGRAWNADKKMIIDLKPKWTPKPFDRVITRNAADDVWTANFFSHMDSHGEYVTIACVGGYTYCLPYNEETAKLIGTKNNWEG